MKKYVLKFQPEIPQIPLNLSLHHMSIVHALDKTFAVRKFVAFRQKCQAFSEHLEDMTSII